MPFQPMNYANIPPQGYPELANLVENLTKGYQAFQVPSERLEESRQNKLKSSLIQAQAAKAEQEALEKKRMNDLVERSLRDTTQSKGPNISGDNPLVKALMNKYLGLPADYEAPEVVSNRKIQQQGAIATNAGNIKEVQALNKEIPLIESRIAKAEKLLPLIEKHPYYFGGVIPQSFRKALINNEDYGTLETGLAELVAPFAQDLSSKGLASALNYAINVKPGFGENQKITVGKIKQIISNYRNSVEQAKKRRDEFSGSFSSKATSSERSDPLGIL